MAEETISCCGKVRIFIDLKGGVVKLKHSDGSEETFIETICGSGFYYRLLKALADPSNVYLIYDYLVVIVDKESVAVKYGDKPFKCFVKTP